jgi:hypothetical protein
MLDGKLRNGIVGRKLKQELSGMDMMPRRLQAAAWRNLVASAICWLAVIAFVCDVMAWVAGAHFWFTAVCWSLALMIGLGVLSALVGFGRLASHHPAAERRHVGAYAGIGLACINFVLRFGARDQISSLAGLALSISTLLLLVWALKPSDGHEGDIEPPTGVY